MMKINHVKSRHLMIMLFLEMYIHIQRVTEARKRYQEEKERWWDDDELVASVDIQKAIILPGIPGLKVDVCYKCIILISETFGPIGGSIKDGRRKLMVSYDMRLSTKDRHQI